ncbi:hypothetical protein E3N88_29416 [Mikania micrantha]|uniref:Tf2-1-like SH3-like domain-containing protein n=1 Tax=Mikania micrantha TaxID=192012 RepID=A0A5N6MJ59_9ASTR|nr:hypothetical protein E3N88_29416 [Mikania micrantha]
MLKVSPWKGVVRFGAKGKLAPRYVGPFQITQRIGPVAYRLKLPDELSGVQDVFHVSNLKRCLADESLIIPLEEIQVDEQLHFIEERVEIMEREVRRLKQSRIPVVKVRWNSKRGPEFTWEREDNMKTNIPRWEQVGTSSRMDEEDVQAFGPVEMWAKSNDPGPVEVGHGPSWLHGSNLLGWAGIMGLIRICHPPAEGSATHRVRLVGVRRFGGDDDQRFGQNPCRFGHLLHGSASSSPSNPVVLQVAPISMHGPEEFSKE